MSQCKQSANEFIQSTFSPHVAVLCSADAQYLCQKNNLSFVQLIQPFCRLSSEVHIRDPSNVTYSIHNLCISFCDMASQSPQQNIIKKQLSDAVACTYGQTREPGASNMTSIGNYDLHLSASTPWFDNWRETFLEVLPPSEHEYLNHCLACIFVVSSNNADPLNAFTSLANKQVSQQQQFPNKFPRWFCQGILHYYVLLHDVVDGEHARAESVYQSMKTMFGLPICHLLQINSHSLNTVESIKGGLPVQPDPWSQFMARPSYVVDYIENDHLPATDESIDFPSKLSDDNKEHAHSDVSTHSCYDNDLDQSGSSGITSSSSCDQFSHPLASPTTDPSRDTPSPDNDPTAATSGYPGESRHLSSGPYTGIDHTQNKPHGTCLTPSDLDRLRIFMHEFVVRALIPWTERQMKVLNEQFISRKGIHRSFFSATKKWFATKPSGPIPASTNTTVVYTRDAPELQLRRLADLACLFQMYDFAYSTYHMVKKDFNNDQAWLHFAGALEMASLSVFLLGSQGQKQYPHHYMETAISTYLTSCRNPHYATRATLTSTEALKKKAMYNEAAMQFLKMTSEDSDLTSALFLEQAAHCFLALKNPMVRKYSFHMVLAGHRFNKAGQKRHSLRCYTQALQVYKGKHWSIAEDHIYFTIGKHYLNLKQLESAAPAFKHLLTKGNSQSTSQQATYLREYIFVYKQLLKQEERNASTYGHLPELPLPIVHSNTTKVLLADSDRKCEVDCRKTPASGMWFDSGEDDQNKWKLLEEKLLLASGRPQKCCPQLFTNTSNNRSSPIAFVGEPIMVAVQVENPLHIMLVLSDIFLLWTFIPSLQETDPQQVISNEVTTVVKNSLADEIIQTSILREVIVQGIQSEYIHMSLTPMHAGQLRVVGLSYNLGTCSQNSSPQEIGQTLASQSKLSSTNSLLVRGKQKLEPQGPRLNGTKEERTQKLYGPDRRLDILVHEEMPNLEVVFCDFPETLLCGEVQCIEIELTNIGKSSLKSLKVISSHPRFFTFGRDSDLPKYPYIYQMRTSQCTSLSSTLTSTMTGRDEFQTFPDVLNISLPKGELQPGQVVSIPMWIRGDDIGGVHEVDFMFYYEPILHSSSVRYRVLAHRALLNTMESLSVHVTVTHPAARVGSIRGQELNSCIFSCELENLCQMQIPKPYVQELQVTQVSCVSPHWTLVNVEARHHSGVRLGSRETLHLILKGLKQDQEKGDFVFSEVTFDRDQVNTSCSPCSDFFIRSWLQHKSLLSECPGGYSTAGTDSTTKIIHCTQLDSAILLNLTLVFLWKAYMVQDSGHMKIVVGQHHVHIDHYNTVSLSYPIPPVVTRTVPLRFTKESTQEEKPPPDPAVTTCLVSYSFTHCCQKEHSFISGVCLVPVGLTLQNHTDTDVHVNVDTSKSPETLNSCNFLSKWVKWISLNEATLTLSKGQSSHLALKVAISQPGTYNLNTISVYVTFSSDQSQMVLQKHTTPSIITIVDTL